MKKADILVIILVLFLSIGFYVIYFSNNLLDSDDEYVIEIYYKQSSEPVYSIKLEEDTNVKVKLTTKDGFLFVEVCDNNAGEYKLYKDPIKTVETREILNIVSIEYNHIHMQDANCENKLCMNMKISKTISTPIFCTNGVLVKLVSEDFRIITG